MEKVGKGWKRLEKVGKGWKMKKKCKWSKLHGLKDHDEIKMTVQVILIDLAWLARNKRKRGWTIKRAYIRD